MTEVKPGQLWGWYYYDDKGERYMTLTFVLEIEKCDEAFRVKEIAYGPRLGKNFYSWFWLSHMEKKIALGDCVLLEDVP